MEDELFFVKFLLYEVYVVDIVYSLSCPVVCRLCPQCFWWQPKWLFVMQCLYYINAYTWLFIFLISLFYAHCEINFYVYHHDNKYLEYLDFIFILLI